MNPFSKTIKWWNNDERAGGTTSIDEVVVAVVEVDEEVSDTPIFTRLRREATARGELLWW